jgi:hypothetical protein
VIHENDPFPLQHVMEGFWSCVQVGSLCHAGFYKGAFFQIVFLSVLSYSTFSSVLFRPETSYLYTSLSFHRRQRAHVPLP